jgi:hypothetical protein
VGVGKCKEDTRSLVSFQSIERVSQRHKKFPWGFHGQEVCWSRFILANARHNVMSYVSRWQGAIDDMHNCTDCSLAYVV